MVALHHTAYLLVFFNREVYYLLEQDKKVAKLAFKNSKYYKAIYG